MKKLKKFSVLTFFIFIFGSILFYLLTRIFMLATTEMSLFDGIWSFLLLLAEFFIIIQTTGYFLNIFRIYNKASSFTPDLEIPELNTSPQVAIVVASYKEPLEILNDTLSCFYNLTYPSKQLYLLDDTRYDVPFDTPEKMQSYRKGVEALCKKLEVNLFRAKWHGAKAGMINDFLLFLSGNVLEGFEFTSNDNKKSQSPEYLIIFDADMNPFPDFVEALVAIMEKEPDLAFIQTPQHYTNFEYNRVARASGLQQAVFYEYICEGKSLQDAMFCCGSNVIFRIKALNEVGGFDEVSVTEDFATSLQLHKKGWKSRYLNTVMAFGMGPEDLGAFFKQQFRWARGTLGVCRELPKEMLNHFGKLSINQWWEYFLSSVHYTIGFIFLIMVTFPITYLFFNIPSYFSNPWIYFSAFVPYMFMTMFMFIFALKKRGYYTKDILSVLMINAVSFPVYIKAAVATLLNLKGTFVVTPKSGSTMLPLSQLLPQIFIGILCMSAITWGFMRLYFEREPFYGILLNMFWTFYNFIMISCFLYFNHPEAEECENSA